MSNGAVASARPARRVRVGRGMVTLGAGVTVALATSVLVFALAQASPSAAQVLHGARQFTAGARSLSYRVTETITAPAAAGEQTVQTRTVQGRLGGGGRDFTVQEGNLVAEYRSVAGSPSVWVRAAKSSAALASASWVRAPSFAAFEQVVAGSGAARAAWLDAVSSGDAVALVLNHASGARRVGTSVRTLRVTLDAQALSAGQAVGLKGASAVITVDPGDRPTGMTVTAQAGAASVGLRYALAWVPVATTAAPAPGDVSATF